MTKLPEISLQAIRLGWSGPERSESGKAAAKAINALLDHIDAMPECGYCKDCKWWDSHLCRLAESDSGQAVNPETKAVARDAVQYRATLVVSADFGCVQYEPKQP